MTKLSCQSQNETLTSVCSKLSKSLYEQSFNYQLIKSNLYSYEAQLQKSIQTEYENCNCADSLWVLRHTHKYEYIKRTHSTVLDTIQFLNSMSHEIDKMNLESEFRFQLPQNKIDSLEYVLSRLKIKYLKKKYIYNLITAEIEFLKKHRYELADNYFHIIDNKLSNPEIIDDLLLSFFNSNNQISDKIKNRIGKLKYDKYFYRMYGIINTSSSSEFPLNQLEILENMENSIDKEKVKFVLKSFYQQDRFRKMKRRNLNNLRRIISDPKFNKMESVDKLKSEIEKSR